jgi:hypothetical protein
LFDTAAFKPLLYSSISLDGTAEHRDAALVESNYVLAAGIPSIYDYLFRSLTRTPFDLLHCWQQMFVIWSCLRSIDSDDNPRSSIRRDLHVVAQSARRS